ncbi:MAG: tetratricopeptide repeat protein [Bacteroidaceae bacterium]|nr:tetratricopeptide repeat protein [Bacteroidaceae bacterium]
MTKKPFIMLPALVAILLTGCSKMGKFRSENFTVTPTPLEYTNGEVPATISVNIPEKFFNKKAIVTCTPVLRWNEGSATGNSATFQGEKVQANNQIISYKHGGRATLRTAFEYAKGMESSDLYMTFKGYKGRKPFFIPEVKIGYGVNCTSNLVAYTVRNSTNGIAKDNFQRAINQKQAATIKFLIAQSNIRGSELNSQNIKDFIATLRNIKNDEESLVLNGIEVSAYASPDGGYNFNEKLADRRGQTAVQYVKSQLKSNQLDTNIDSKYTAEDWEGFQELVSQSNIQDKDLILRVLSMYNDPEQREREIQNISHVYGELAEAVLPELRRARMVINYDVVGRTDEQIKETFKTSPESLSVEELVYYGNLIAEDINERQDVYEKTIQLYPDDYRAYNNLAEIAMQNHQMQRAESYLNQAVSKNPNAPEPNVNLGTLRLMNNDVKGAEEYFAKGAGSNNINEAMGNLYIAQGQYSKAAQVFNGINNNSAALAQILSKDYAAAATTLANIKNADATTSYLKAILAARQNDKDNIANNLRDAIMEDDSFAKRVRNDLEFSKYATIVSAVVR